MTQKPLDVGVKVSFQVPFWEQVNEDKIKEILNKALPIVTWAIASYQKLTTPVPVYEAHIQASLYAHRYNNLCGLCSLEAGVSEPYTYLVDISLIRWALERAGINVVQIWDIF